MRLGRNMQHALDFARKHESWSTFTQDRATKGAIQRLERLGLVTVNEFQQFKATRKELPKL